MKRSLLVLAIISAPAFASPPCDESKGYYEAFDLFTLSNQCFAMNVWDWTPTLRNSGINFTAFGGGNAGGAAGAGASGASGAGAGASGAAGAAGSDGGDSGGNAGDSGPAGCDA